jgi:ribosomal protein S19
MKQKNIGATALLTLETQILTLKETILCLEPMIKEEESLSGSQGAPEGVAFDTKIQVNANDFKKLQEEYNTLLFKKHQVWCRSFVIPKTFVGLSFQVHNGSKFVLLKVTEKIVGYRFGEFVPTRKVTVHKEVKKKK